MKEAELRDKLTIMVANTLFAGLSLEQINKLRKSELEKFQVLIDSLLDLYRENERLTRINEIKMLIPSAVAEMASIDPEEELKRLFDDMRGRLDYLQLSNTHKTGGTE